MLVEDIVKKIEKVDKMDVYRIEYKSQEDKEKYGTSFDTFLNDKDFIFAKVNGGTFKVKRICEEYGRILFIYNFEQISYSPQDIYELELDIKD